MKGIDISHLPRPLQWAVILFFIGILILVMREFSNEVKEIAGEDSYAHNASKSGLEGLENLKEGAETAQDIESTLNKLPKK